MRARRAQKVRLVEPPAWVGSGEWVGVWAGCGGHLAVWAIGRERLPPQQPAAPARQSQLPPLQHSPAELPPVLRVERQQLRRSGGCARRQAAQDLLHGGSTPTGCWGCHAHTRAVPLRGQRGQRWWSRHDVGYPGGRVHGWVQRWCCERSGSLPPHPRASQRVQCGDPVCITRDGDHPALDDDRTYVLCHGSAPLHHLRARLWRRAGSPGGSKRDRANDEQTASCGRLGRGVCFAPFVSELDVNRGPPYPGPRAPSPRARAVPAHQRVQKRSRAPCTRHRVCVHHPHTSRTPEPGAASR